eukprot:2191767-Amphidinium_carterae.1
MIREAAIQADRMYIQERTLVASVASQSDIDSEREAIRKEMQRQEESLEQLCRERLEMRGVMDSQLKSFQDTLAAREVQSRISDDARRQECSEFRSELAFSAGRAARVEIEAAQANTLVN